MGEEKLTEFSDAHSDVRVSIITGFIDFVESVREFFVVGISIGPLCGRGDLSLTRRPLYDFPHIWSFRLSRDRFPVASFVIETAAHVPGHDLFVDVATDFAVRRVPMNEGRRTP